MWRMSAGVLCSNRLSSRKGTEKCTKWRRIDRGACGFTRSGRKETAETGKKLKVTVVSNKIHRKND